MPVLVQSGSGGSSNSSVLNSSITLQQISDDARSFLDLIPQNSASGWTQRPALWIANAVISKIISQPMPWKYNRVVAAPFLTIALQQDYITNITNLFWLESGWRQDINNTSTPQPVFTSETVRDLGKTSTQQNPFNVSWVYNRQAIMGTWVKNTSYPTGLGQAMTPASPIQQFIDVNNNILYVTTNGTSGNSQPSLPANSAPGTTVADGSVTWTVADPNAIAFRLSPIPPFSGIVWQMTLYYQMKPPKFTSLTQNLSPIPDEYAYLFRDGFIALCKQHAGAKDAQLAYAAWEEALQTAIRAGDRELENAVVYVSESLMGGNATNFPYWGPSFPYTPYGWS